MKYKNWDKKKRMIKIVHVQSIENLHNQLYYNQKYVNYTLHFQSKENCFKKIKTGVNGKNSNLHEQ